MKLFSFPAASLEKAIHKRVLTLPSPHKEWFTERWAQKPYKKAFVENKAMPLVMVAKGKTWDDAPRLPKPCRTGTSPFMRLKPRCCAR